MEILTRKTSTGTLVISFANETDALINLHLDGEFVTTAGATETLPSESKGCTHWIGKPQKGKAFGLNAKEAALIDSAREQRFVVMREASKQRRDAKAAKEKLDLFNKAGEFEIPEGMEIAVNVGTVTGGDDGWGEDTNRWWNVYETKSGVRTGFDDAKMVVLSTCGWDNRPETIALMFADVIDIDAIAAADKAAKPEREIAAPITQAEEASATRLEEKYGDDPHGNNPGYCKRCKSYCYGDCTA